jgi:hypothetical protein
MAFHGFPRELDGPGKQRLVGLFTVACREADREPRRAFRNELADVPARGVIHSRRPRLLEQDIAARLPGYPDGQPSHEPEVLIGADFEAELPNVEFRL